MTRRYRVLLPLRVHTPAGSYGQGEEFAHEFTADDELENVASGLLEIVPATYKVVGESTVHGTEPGGTFTAALPLGQEELLVQGGHIRPSELKPRSRKKA